MRERPYARCRASDVLDAHGRDTDAIGRTATLPDEKTTSLETPCRPRLRMTLGASRPSRKSSLSKVVAFRWAEEFGRYPIAADLTCSVAEGDPKRMTQAGPCIIGIPVNLSGHS